VTLNLPPRVRQALYILTALGTPAVVYAQARGYIGALEVTLWSGEVAVVSAMAGFNVTDPIEQD
jgi:hypothetical protein